MRDINIVTDLCVGGVAFGGVSEPDDVIPGSGAGNPRVFSESRRELVKNCAHYPGSVFGGTSRGGNFRVAVIPVELADGKQ